MICPSENAVKQPNPRHQGASTRHQYAILGLGLLYLSITLACSLTFVLLLTPTMVNHLFWPHFNRTGYQAFLIDLLNGQLDTIQHGSVDLYALSMRKSYADSDTIHFNSGYARRVFYSEFNHLYKAIQSILNTDVTKITSIYAHYCWVDFGRRWSLEHNEARARRCVRRQVDNAAAYLESLRRNTDWAEFLATMHDKWLTAIQSALMSTPPGIAWLNLSKSFLSLPDEVLYLQSLNLTRYDIQWQNRVQMGIVETIVLQNALQFQEMVTIKAQESAWGPWTTVLAYWSLESDLAFATFKNGSLVREANNHIMDTSWSAAYPVQDTSGHVIAQLSVLLTVFGSFGSLDLVNVAMPPSFAALANAFNTKLREVTTTQSPQYATDRDVLFFPIPPKFVGRGLLFGGGNLFCYENALTAYPQSQIAFDDKCNQLTQMSIQTTYQALLFAFLVSGATNLTAISTARIMDALQSEYVANAIAEAPPIEFVQYRYAQDNNSEWRLLRQPLLTADAHWSFYGWIVLFDWIQGQREVLQVDGDAETLVVISEAHSRISMATSSDIDMGEPNLHFYYYLMVYSTVLCFVVALALLLPSFVGDFKWMAAI
ncbi:hypothetical protein AeRB84_016508 [Aphanomyces euteiches]|nr:hypothetical protein AeRB84_016508 [Aphanomyces euteiches]